MGSVHWSPPHISTLSVFWRCCHVNIIPCMTQIPVLVMMMMLFACHTRNHRLFITILYIYMAHCYLWHPLLSVNVAHTKQRQHVTSDLLNFIFLLYQCLRILLNFKHVLAFFIEAKQMSRLLSKYVTFLISIKNGIFQQEKRVVYMITIFIRMAGMADCSHG